jgi:hypothetical protein
MAHIVTVSDGDKTRLFLAEPEALTEFAIVVTGERSPEDLAGLGVILTEWLTHPVTRKANGTLPALHPASVMPRAGTIYRELAAFVIEHPGSTAAEIGARTGGRDQSSVYSGLKRARDAGLVVNIGGAWYPADTPAPAQTIRTRASTPGLRRRWTVTLEDVHAYITDHPGAIATDITRDLLGATTEPERHTISSRLLVLRDNGQVRAEEFYVGKMRRVRWYAT